MTLFIRLDKKCEWVARGAAIASGSGAIEKVLADTHATLLKRYPMRWKKS